MPKGNPNPSPETRFQPGQSGNPGGKTSQQVSDEREAARISAELRLKLLSSMQEKVLEGIDPLELLSSDALRLFKDSEDRAHGQPDQNVNAKVETKGADKLKGFIDNLAERSGTTGEPSTE